MEDIVVRWLGRTLQGHTGSLSVGTRKLVGAVCVCGVRVCVCVWVLWPRVYVRVCARLGLPTAAGTLMLP